MRKFISIIIVLIFAGCGEQNDIPLVSDNPEIQSAYSKCVLQTQTDIEKDNPNTDADVMQMMKNMALDTCNSLVVTTCTSNYDSIGCQSMLEQFK